MTTSLKVAEVFGKYHKHVLRDIEQLECSETFTESNFGLSEYKDSTGRRLPMYRMTRDGFSFLVMGFTGKRAAHWKEQYIKAIKANSKVDPGSTLKGRKIDLFNITTGRNGGTSALWKEKFIHAVNMMEDRLRNLVGSILSHPLTHRNQTHSLRRIR